MRNFFKVTMLLVAISGWSQDITSIIDPSMRNGDIWAGAGDSKIDGHPFYIDTWCLGSVDTDHGKYEGINVKFDTYRGVLLVKKGDVINSINTSVVNSFMFSYDGIEYDFVKFDGKYMRILYSEQSLVAQLYKKSLKEGQESNGYNGTTSATKDRLIDATENYISLDNGTSWKKIASKKDFQKVLNEGRLEIISKARKLKIKSVDDLVEIMRLYDGI